MMKYDNLLFDLDGLLVDTGDGVFHCVKYALNYFGIQVPDEDKALYIGPPLMVSFVKYGHLPEKSVTEAINKYRELYHKVIMNESHLYDGIAEMLEKLSQKGFNMFVATSKLESYAVDLLNHLGVGKYFKVIGGCDPEEKLANKSMVIADVLRRAGIQDCSNVLMIGDRCYDDEGAKKMEIDSLGVYMNYSVEGEHEEAGASYIAKGVSGMEETLLSFAD